MTGKRLKKIAVLSPTIPPDNLGGVAVAHYNLFRQFCRQGYDARMFTFQDRANRWGEVPSDSRVVHAGVSGAYVKVADLMVYFWMRLLRSRGISYNLTDIFAHSAGALKLRGRLREFGPDVVVLPDQGAPGFFLGKPAGVHYVLIAHHNPMRFIDIPQIGNFSRKDAELAVAVENRVLKNVDLVICPSLYMRKVFLETYSYAGPIRVIPNLLDRDTLNAVRLNDVRSLLGLDRQIPLIYIPGAGNPFKGAKFVYDLLRRLAERYPAPVGVYLSGAIDPTLAARLRELPSSLRLYSPGNLPHEQNLAIVKACSFGISPTLVENFSMALLEANSCQIPMLTFDVGGNREIIRDGRNGRLIPCADLPLLVECAEQLLTTPDMLAALCVGCDEVSREISDEKHIFKCYLEAMEGVIN